MIKSSFNRTWTGAKISILASLIALSGCNKKPPKLSFTTTSGTDSTAVEIQNIKLENPSKVQLNEILFTITSKANEAIEIIEGSTLLPPAENNFDTHVIKLSQPLLPGEYEVIATIKYQCKDNQEKEVAVKVPLVVAVSEVLKPKAITKVKFEAVKGKDSLIDSKVACCKKDGELHILKTAPTDKVRTAKLDLTIENQDEFLSGVGVNDLELKTTLDGEILGIKKIVAEGEKGSNDTMTVEFDSATLTKLKESNEKDLNITLTNPKNNQEAHTVIKVKVVDALVNCSGCK